MTRSLLCFGDSNKFVIEVQNKTEFYNSLQWNFDGNDFDPNESNKEKTNNPINYTMKYKYINTYIFTITSFIEIFSFY